MIPDFYIRKLVTLPVGKVTVEGTLGPEVSLNFNAANVRESIISDHRRHLLHKLVGYFAESEHEVVNKIVTILSPATWWDHFKMRWFPTWLKSRFPVKFAGTPVDTEIRVTRICPHLDVGGRRDHIDFLISGETGNKP